MPKDHITVDQSSPHPAQQSVRQPGRDKYLSAGFTLLELIVVTAIIAILATIGFPLYHTFVTHARNSRAMSEIRLLETEINDYQVQTGMLPANLAAIGRGGLKDPWGVDNYQYSTTPARRFGTDLLNEDFDLFSKGDDGISEDLVHVLVVGGPGSDDLVRGEDGAFLGTGAAWVGEE